MASATRPPIANPSSPQTILLALSGPSSSGKTTLARLLHRRILPRGHSTLLHLDDFYRPEAELPMRNGLVDWDSAGALDLVALESTLAHIRSTGSFPPDFHSKEDSNDIGACPIPETTIAKLRERVHAWWERERVGERVDRIVIVDGFLLLGESILQVRELFDVRILLRASFDDAKRRREARSGYATIEGWWQDPPGYVEKVVWPGFVEEHAFMFKEGNVEGDVREDVVGKLGVRVAPKEMEGDLGVTLGWVIDVIEDGVERQVGHVAASPVTRAGD